MFVAGLGVRYLLRTFAWQGPAVAVAMVAYALTPYLLTIAPRISAILLPYAALPWLLALTVRALRTGELAPPRGLRAHRGHRRHEQRHRRSCSSASVRPCGSCGPLATREQTLRARRAPRSGASAR